jgi:hypothetical protein
MIGIDILTLYAHLELKQELLWKMKRENGNSFMSEEV